MTKTFQFSNINMLDHGQMVFNKTKLLISGELKDFKLPEWFVNNHAIIISNLYDISIVEEYNILHDCGKPYRKVTDDNGKNHYPNHAEVSKNIYLEFSESLNKDVIAELIGLDMLLHTSTVEEIKALKIDVKTAVTLLITSFAEIHANAEMFGGIESISFKIKYKKLCTIGKALLVLHQLIIV